MALVAWYPLNGDIENHGVGNASFSSTSGSIFVNNGKTEELGLPNSSGCC